MTTTSLPQLAAPLTAGFSHSYAAIILLLTAHFLFLAIFFRTAISTPDANGYMAQQLMAQPRGEDRYRRRVTGAVCGGPLDGGGRGKVLRSVSTWITGIARPGIPADGLVSDALGAAGHGNSGSLGLYLVVREWVGSGVGTAGGSVMAVNPG